MAEVGRRTAKQREMHIGLIAGWLNRGWDVRRIAAELGLSERSVYRDVDEVKRVWKEERLDYWRSLSREVEDINRQIDELWAAWERSKERQATDEATIFEGVGVRRQNRQEIGAARTAKRVDSYGDPRIMAEITKLREQRIKLLGLNAPIKVAPTTPEGEPLQLNVDPDSLYEAITHLRARLALESGDNQPEGYRVLAPPLAEDSDGSTGAIPEPYAGDEGEGATVDDA